MSLAGGVAYSYKPYAIDNQQAQKGSLWYVFTDCMRTFKSDWRLIKPKKFGYESKAEIVSYELKSLDSDIKD
jgi:hypothetical protein